MKPLVVFELANNHMGDFEHGLATINAFGDVADQSRDIFDFGFKLQYRDLDTFIHPSAKGRQDGYVKRFEDTRLARWQFSRFLAEMRKRGFRTVCTPFDEPSVDRIEEDGVEVIKVSSCSFTDWPLLERIGRSEKPVIASTGGATLDEIDAVARFFANRNRDLTLLHCVAEYPTGYEHLALRQISVLRERYPGVRVGLSTHENGWVTDSVKLALALGAVVFEKHVALETEKYKANAYSTTPADMLLWLDGARSALSALGREGRREASETERNNLRSLRRGVFARRDIKAFEYVTSDDVYFAFPAREGQLTANDWSKYASTATGSEPIKKDAPIMAASVVRRDHTKDVGDIVVRVRDLLAKSGVAVPKATDLEISHHSGIRFFDKVGITMLTVVNREYCKKLLVMLPGQKHPEQYHKKKEETFVVLHGEMVLKLDGIPRLLRKGDVVTIDRGVRHEMITETGVVFEEISSTHCADDSYYTDPQIGTNPARKTRLTYWMPQ